MEIQGNIARARARALFDVHFLTLENMVLLTAWYSPKITKHRDSKYHLAFSLQKYFTTSFVQIGNLVYNNFSTIFLAFSSKSSYLFHLKYKWCNKVHVKETENLLLNTSIRL